MQKLYTQKEVAEYFKVSVRAVQKWVADGELFPATIKSRRLFAEGELVRFFVSRGGSMPIITKYGKIIKMSEYSTDWLSEEISRGIKREIDRQLHDSCKLSSSK